MNLTAKQLAQGEDDPDSRAVRCYKRVKSWRKFGIVWNVLSLIWSFSWFAYYTFLRK